MNISERLSRTAVQRTQYRQCGLIHFSSSCQIGLALSNEPPSPQRRFLKRVLLFAVLHYLCLSCLSGVIFLVSHIPPKAVNLDTILSALVFVENILVAPRKLLLWSWPWETTPAGLGLALTGINSLTWGLALATLKTAWRKVT